MSFRFYDPESRLWSIYWATAAARAARPARDRILLWDTGIFEGEDTFDGRADPRALHLVRSHHADAALGAGILRRRRDDVGDELGHGVHADRRRGP